MNLFALIFPVVAAAAPTPLTPSAPVSATGYGVSSFTNGASQVEVQTTGDVTFDPDSDELFDLHGDGTLRIREKTGSTIRLLTASSTQITYTVNGVARPYDPEGKAWLRQLLQTLPPTPTPPTPPPT